MLVEVANVDNHLVEDEEGALLKVYEANDEGALLKSYEAEDRLVEDGENILLEELTGELEDEVELAFMRDSEVELVAETLLELLVAALCVVGVVDSTVELDLVEALDAVILVVELDAADALGAADKLDVVGKLGDPLVSCSRVKFLGEVMSGMLIVPGELAVACAVTANIDVDVVRTFVPVLKPLSCVLKVLVGGILLMSVTSMVLLIEEVLGTVALAGRMLTSVKIKNPEQISITPITTLWRCEPQYQTTGLGIFAWSAVDVGAAAMVVELAGTVLTALMERFLATVDVGTTIIVVSLVGR